MKKIFLLTTVFLTFTLNAKSMWTPTGEMSAGNTDYVY